MNALFRSSRLASGLLPVACISVGLALTASGSAATRRPRTVNALVVGNVAACPAHPTTGYCPITNHAVVSAFGSQHRLVVRETITNGHFSFLVRPGKLRLVARSSNSHRGVRTVTAVAHKTVHANMEFVLK
jgi:hypothetical protein